MHFINETLYWICALLVLFNLSLFLYLKAWELKKKQDDANWEGWKQHIETTIKCLKAEEWKQYIETTNKPTQNASG